MGRYEEYQKVNKQLLAHNYHDYRDVVAAMVDCYHKYIKPIDKEENGTIGIMVFFSIINNKCESANIFCGDRFDIEDIHKAVCNESIRLQRYIFLSLGYTFEVKGDNVLIGETIVYTFNICDNKPTSTLVRKDGKKC